MSEKMHYFSAVEGRAFRRPGTDAFIGATRTKEGFIINISAVVAIPDKEVIAFKKDYLNAIRRGDLKARTKPDYEEWQKKRTEQSKAAAKKRDETAKKATEKNNKNDSEASAAD